MKRNKAVKPIKAWALIDNNTFLYNHWFGGKRYPEIYANQKHAEQMVKESDKDITVIPVLIIPLK